MKLLLAMCFICTLTNGVFSNGEKMNPLRVVDSLDLSRYVGTWYEIARLPNKYQNNCTGDVSAKYTLLDDGSVKVVNRCLKENGEITEAEGRARRASSIGPNTKLEVRFAPAILSFLPLVWGDYWLIDLASDYSYAVVGEPKRRYLWVLARSKEMDEATLNNILAGVKDQGYDTATLIRTKHTK